MIEDRITKLRDELNLRNKEIDILKGEASKQINHIRGSIAKFLDEETGTLGERIRTLFKEQDATIMSISTAAGIAVGFVIESLLGSPTVSTTSSGNTSGDDRKSGGAREWIKKQIESFITIIRQISRQSIDSATRNHRFDTFMDFEPCERSGWLVVSEFLGTYNRCQSFDLHIFYNKNKKWINHLDIHHTVKIDVIINIKAVLSCS